MHSQLVASTIDSVCCHRSGALVRRSARLEALAAGSETKIRIVDLPLSLEDDSVRLRASGSAAVFDAAVGLEAAQQVSVERSREEQQLEQLAAEQTTLQARLESLEETLRLLDSVELRRRPKGPRGQPPQSIDVAARLSLLELTQGRAQALLVERRSLREALVRVKREREQLEETLRRLAGSLLPNPNELRKSVVATLRVPADAGQGAISLTLEYFVAAARWAPSYVLRADTAKNRASMELRAYVHQATGEDWPSVKISLSTADYMRFTDLPELSSLRIGRAQPAPKKRKWRPPPCDPAELFADYAREGSELEPSPTAPPFMRNVALGSAAALSTLAFAARGSHAPQAASQMAMPQPAAISAPRNAPMAPAPPMQSSPRREQRKAADDDDDDLESRPAPPLAKESNAGRAGSASGAGLRAKQRGVSAPEGVELDDRLMSYGDLRMPPPDQRKGKLELSAIEQRYLEVSSSLDAAMGAIVREMLGESGRRLGTSGWMAGGKDEDERPALARPWPVRCSEPQPSDGFAYVHEGSSRVDVPSDGGFHSIPVTSFETELTLRHVAVPRETADVFRFVELDSPIDAPLLKGPCDVYFDRDFLLTIDLDTVPPRGRVRAGLGVDQSVKSARNTSYAETTTGLMGGSLSLKHTIKIEVINHRAAQIDVEVRERVPIAHEREDDIKVEITGVQPDWRPWEPTPPDLPIKGAYLWRVRLAPQQRAELTASYVVKIPSKLELSGGNRRD